MFRLIRRLGRKLLFTIIGLISGTTLILKALSGCTTELKNVVPEDVLNNFITNESNSINNDESFKVHFIDVGQGDSTLIECDGEYMLIDAGENDKGTLVQNYLEKQGVTTLKYAIGTHPDSDHIGGLDVIITKFDCETILMPDCKKDTATYRDVIDAIEYKNYKITYPVVGNTYMLGDSEITIVSPSYNYSDANNNSIVLKVTYGESDFLFMGDAEMEAEKNILNAGINLDCEVLKVGHHGSSSSSSKGLLASVTPDYAIISCGENNSYGHPHKETLQNLTVYNVSTYRTDTSGTIIVVSDGKTINFK